MAKSPQKIYYDIARNDAVDADFLTFAKQLDYPGIKIGQTDFLVNVQVYNNKDTSNDPVKYGKIPSNATAQWFTDDDYSNPTYTNFSVGSSNWTLSSSGTGEYYYSETLVEPDSIINLLTVLSAGTVGSLSASSWDFADNDTIGESRVYVRLSDDSDPDLLDSGVLRYVAGGDSYTKLFLQAFAADFNQASTWWDSSTETFRNPVLTDGEITFYLDSSTTDFAARLAASTDTAANTDTFTEIQFIENGTSEIFLVLKFGYNCLNRLLANAIPTTATGNPSYSKTESDALYEPKISDTQATLTDDTANYITMASKTTYNTAWIKGTIDNGTNKQSFNGYVFTGNGTTADCFIDISDHAAALTTITYTADISGDNMRLIITLASVTGTIKVNYVIYKFIINAV